VLTRPVSELDEIGTTFGLSAAGQRCVYCGELTHDPAILWSGGEGSQIYIHAECVDNFCTSLLRDMRECLTL